MAESDIQITDKMIKQDTRSYCYRDPRHSELIRLFFPDCSGGNGSGGVDLPKISLFGSNVEIKESRLTNRMLCMVHLKDLKEADYILFFYWRYYTFYLIKLPEPWKQDKIDDMELTDQEKIGLCKKFILENTIKRWRIRKTFVKLKEKLDIQTYINTLRLGLNP